MDVAAVLYWIAWSVEEDIQHIPHPNNKVYPVPTQVQVPDLKKHSGCERLAQ